jgi:hypothetical protein
MKFWLAGKYQSSFLKGKMKLTSRNNNLVKSLFLCALRKQNSLTKKKYHRDQYSSSHSAVMQTDVNKVYRTEFFKLNNSSESVFKSTVMQTNPSSFKIQGISTKNYLKIQGKRVFPDFFFLVNKRISWLKQGIRLFPENSGEYAYSLKVLVPCNRYRL